MATGFERLTLEDGAQLAYEVYGSYYLGSATPIVLVCGMSTIRCDWDRLSRSLAKSRPVLLYDHRGMGDSTLGKKGEDMTIELLARDLLALLKHLQWKEVAICGFSMGGVVAQQLLTLPYIANNPVELPFSVSHLILAGTRSVVEDVGLKFTAAPADKPRTQAEKLAIARRLTEACFDPKWLVQNGPRFNQRFAKVVTGISQRPGNIIAKQGLALKKFDFADLLHNIPENTPNILVIHGEVDQIIPPRCGEDVLKRLSGARRLEVGEAPGQVPSLEFGHYWYEYFDIKVWDDVVNVFINDGATITIAPELKDIDHPAVASKLFSSKEFHSPTSPRHEFAYIIEDPPRLLEDRGLDLYLAFTNPACLWGIMSNHSTYALPDGAVIAYEVLGASHLGKQTPIVLVGGMSSLRGDWDRLSTRLAEIRPVLIFDHRGMGDSTLATKKDNISIESLARDLLFLLNHLQWRELSLMGFSMGGLIAQQVVFMPYLQDHPTPLPFRVTHLFLAATLCSVLRDKRYGLKVVKSSESPNTRPRKLTEAQKKRIARPILASTFDPDWVEDPKNAERFDWWLNRQIVGRPTSVILSQGRATMRFNFDGLHGLLPRDLPVLVIHGELDGVVPRFCGEEILQRIPWAKEVEIGSKPGQIPNLKFGHHWFEYFDDPQIWVDVVEKFLKSPGSGGGELGIERSRL